MPEFFAQKMGEHAEPSGNVVSFIPMFNETINKDFILWELDKYTKNESVQCPTKTPKT